MSDSCGCCEALVSPTPECIENRPGLSAIAYRVGTFATFRQAMLEAIAGKSELSQWTTRASDDYGIALLEMWAYLGDILAFYQERIANEAFLRTAVFRESVLRLAALLDYQPANGVAATAYLAFTAEDGKTVEITPGMRVQSVPGQDETAQKFETIESATAVSELNQFRVYPRPQPDTPLAKGRTGSAAVTHVPVPNGSAGAALGDISHLAPGDKIVVFQPTLRTLSGKDQVKLLRLAEEMGLSQVEARYTLMEQIREALQTSVTPEWGGGGMALWVEDAYDAKDEAIEALAQDDTTIPKPIREQIVEVLLQTEECDERLIHVEDKEIEDIQTVDWRQEITWTPDIRCGFAAGAEVYKWRRKFRLFGHNAPSEFFSVGVDANDNVTWQQESYNYYLSNLATLELDAVYDDLKENTELLLVARLSNGVAVQLITVVATEQVNAEVVSSSGGAPVMQATVTRLTLTPSLPLGIDVRTAVLYELEGPAITLWQEKYGDLISGSDIYLALEDLDMDAEEAEQLLEPGRRIILEDDDGKVQATAVSSSEIDGDHLKVTLDDALSEALDATTATGRANVVLATHGETVADETLGSGDAASELQSFTLKKSPVTFVPQAGAKNGAANTLEVRVDGVLWQEADTLYGRKGDQRVYTTSVDNDSAMTVQFGDGKTGARLPTGQSNVVATYRQGIGKDGNVSATSLATPLDKPVGLKEVVNPAAAAGGAEPESLDDARANAPNTVRTFDRIVSLRDFEDAARSFAGVAKARATWQWQDEEQVVLLTVAGDEGAEIEAGGETHQTLVADLDSRRDPNRKLVVDSYSPVSLQIEAAIQVDTDYVDEDVQAEALAALSDYFDFDNLDLGQPIHLSDVYRVLQEVEGVVAVDVDRLQFKKAADRVSHGASTKPLQAHLVIFPTELATVATADLTVNVGLS